MLKVKRCPWVNESDSNYVNYHDREWGKPVKNDQKLFELLILEGAQAGLSWQTILNKRKNYRQAFKNFNPKDVARMNQKDVARLLQNPGIVRNKLKITSTITNAKAFLELQKEYGSFKKYLWSYVNGKTIVKRPHMLKDYVPRDDLSDTISKDLKRRGFKFVGSTIIYAYLQAVGVIDEHSKDCFKSK
ncbi:MAG: DNA-3-methyladenine glycosylase I [Bdellovibrionales bacterium]|nr:DNA-3-methyladenine glycosylase I [Bdellovibrionales bacterium]